VDGSGAGAQPGDPAEGLAPRPNPANPQLDPDAEAQVGAPLWQRACDACFADDSWLAQPGKRDLPVPAVAAESSGPATQSAAAAAVLAVALGGYWSAQRAETESRTGRRLLS
jgi:hypothetical protein